MNDYFTGNDLFEIRGRLPPSKKVYPFDSQYLQDGYEYPTLGYRIPLTIQSNNTDTRLGSYSIHTAGTSFIFPQASNGGTSRLHNGDIRWHTTGRYIVIETDSPTITIAYELLSHTQTTGRSGSGVDIYEMSSFAEVTFKGNFLRNTSRIGSVSYNTGATTGNSKKLIFLLPNYNGFEDLNFTFVSGSTSLEFEPYNESTKLPILTYGTSIDQGDGRGRLRPGLAMWSRVMVHAKREVINLGVAGSSMMEYKMADFLANIESEVFIFNPGWNLTATAVTSDKATANGAPANMYNSEIVARAVYMINTYRATHPNTPIIVMCQLLKRTDGKRTKDLSTIPGVAYTDNTEDYWYSRESALLRSAYKQALDDGITNIHFLNQKITDSMLSGSHGYPNLIDDNDLHYGDSGMQDSANFILQKIKEIDSSIYDGPIPIVE